MSSENKDESFQHVIFSFDLEYTGKQAIALGCSVQNERREELDTLMIKGYLPGKTVFDRLRKLEFWDHNPEILVALQCDDPTLKTPEQVEAKIADRFAIFYIKWEQYAYFRDLQFHLVSDNKSFDGGLMNELFDKYEPELRRLPFRLWKGTYETFWETHSMQKQLLYSLGISQDWNLPEKVREVFDLPASPWQSDHNPLNDARNIAVEYSDLLGLGPEKLSKALQKQQSSTPSS